jgi:cytochrome d ubiquinol oxidase subunit I
MKGAPMNLLVMPDEANERNSIEALAVPNALSILAFNDPNAEVKGLKDFPKEDRPPVLITFLSFRVMVGLGTLFPILAGLAWLWREKIQEKPWLLKALIYTIPLPYAAIMFGWTVAEVGRQPWIVYGMMRTNDAVSPVDASSVLTSIIAFVVVYSLLGVLDIYLLRKYALKGPKKA